MAGLKFEEYKPFINIINSTDVLAGFCVHTYTEHTYLPLGHCKPVKLILNILHKHLCCPVCDSVVLCVTVLSHV